MIDLTPLDVRKKKGDFPKGFRGYEIADVDRFLDLTAERMEELVRENAMLKERTAQLAEALNAFRGREQAMNEALVTAQQLREEIRSQADRDAELTLREARVECDRLLSEAKRSVAIEHDAILRIHSHRERFLRTYRGFLEGQLADLRAEERRGGSTPVADSQPGEDGRA